MIAVSPDSGHIRVASRPHASRDLVHPRALRARAAEAKARGALEDAAGLLIRASSLAPTDAGVLLELGLVLEALGRAADGVLVVQRALRGDPASILLRHHLGRLLFRAGRAADAEALLNDLVSEVPLDAGARRWLGRALLHRGAVGPAARMLRTAARLSGEDCDTVADLIDAQIASGAHREARIWVDRLGARRPGDPRVAVLAGRLALATGDDDAAARAFRQAGRAPSLAAAARNGFAEVERRRGDAEGVAVTLRPAVRDGSLDAAGAATLARASAADGVGAAAVLPVVERLLAAPGLPALEAADLSLAHGDLLDALGQPARAAAAWLGGHRRLPVRFDALRFAADMDAVQAAFSPAHFASVHPGRGGTGPVFVVGMPHSGVGLVGKLLSWHPGLTPAPWADIAAAVERVPVAEGRPYPECMDRLQPSARQQLAERVLGRDNGLGPVPVVARADQLPHLGLIATLFPHARIVVVERDAADLAVAWARAPLAGGALPFAGDPFDMAAYRDRMAGLMAHWEQVLPMPLIRVSYEAVTANPAGTLRALYAALGLDEAQSAIPADEALRRPERNGARYARWLLPQG
jgi:Flp pilus assembly protein TadD